MDFLYHSGRRRENFNLTTIFQRPASAQANQALETPPRESDDKARSERARLLRDILSGAVEPVIRKIKIAGYQLSLPEIKDLLDGLKSNGVLEDGKRNSYQLVVY